MYQILIIENDPALNFPNIGHSTFLSKIDGLNYLEKVLLQKERSEGYEIQELVNNQLQFIARKDNKVIYITFLYLNND